MIPEQAMQVITILSGLALFLFGMKMMSDSLQVAAGSKFKSILNGVTKNRFVGVGTGAFMTAVIQSSSATTVMTVGLVNAGLLGIAQAASVIMGANIGTTMTGIIAALKVSEIAPIAIIIGVLIIMSSKREIGKHRGRIVFGLGALFLGMNTMSAVLKPLANTEMATNVLQSIQNPFIGILIGIVFTAIIQSSSATTVTVITLVTSGILDVHTGIFIIYGAEIGTCITSLLATIGASRIARKVSVIHFTFNTFGTALFTTIALLPIGYFDMIARIMPNEGGQIATAHLIFNVGTTAMLLPFIKYLVKWADFIVPTKEDEKSGKRLLHLDTRMLTMPQIAVELTYSEVQRMAMLTLENYRLSVDTFINRNPKNIDAIKKNEETINYLNHEITNYLVKLSGTQIGKDEQKLVGSLYHIVNDIERVGDYAENIMEFSASFIEDGKMFSDEAVGELRNLTEGVEQVLKDSIRYFSKRFYFKKKLDLISAEEEKIDDLVEQFKENHIERLNKGKCTPTSGMLFINMLSDLERISDHAYNIAFKLYTKSENPHQDLVLAEK